MIAFSAIAGFAGSTLSSYFSKKGLDVVLFSEPDFKDELNKTILKSLENYEKTYPQENQGLKYPFYGSQRIINELLAYRVMQDEDYNINDLTAALQSEPHVIPPSIEDIEHFYEIFKANIDGNDKLKKLEIKQTFSKEVFNISRKLDEYQRNIENILLSFDADLENQWRSRLDIYIETIKAFKPQTALSLLESLSLSISEGTKRPSNQFLSLIEFQKGVCYSFIGNLQEASKAFISAYKLNPDNLIFKERAASAYYKINEVDKAISLADEIIAQDEFNVTGWAVKLLISTITGFVPLLQKIPVLVKTDIAFKTQLFNNFSRLKQADYVALLYENHLIPVFSDYVVKPITIDTYGEHVFWLSLTINEYYKCFFLNFFEVDESDKEILSALNNLIERYFAAINGTEIDIGNDELRFIYAYTNFMLTQDGKYAAEMKGLFANAKSRDQINLVLTANALQLSGSKESAIELLEQYAKNNMQAEALLAYLYVTTHNISNYTAATKKVLELTKEVTDLALYAHLNTLIQLKVYGKLEEFSIDDFIGSRVFESVNGRTLSNILAELLLSDHTPAKVSELRAITGEFTDPKILGVIATAFHIVGENDLSVEVFRKFIDKETPNRDLLYYIYALYHTKKDSTELLQLLKSWRINGGFHPEFLKTELQIRSELLEWKECEQVCEYYLQNDPDDESALVQYAIALFHLNDEESNTKLAGIVNKLSDFNYKSLTHVNTISTILIKRKFFEEGLELLYKYASRKENTALRKDYFMACVECSQGEKNTGPLKEFDEAAVGSFIKYQLNEKVFFIELTEENVREEFYKNFIGVKTGGAITAKRALTEIEDTIFIERIMNKYLRLHDEIMDVVNSDPYSGIGLTPITFNGSDIDSLNETLRTLFGSKGTASKNTSDELLVKYYNGNLSFSELVFSIFNNDFIGGYFHLVEQQKGIMSIPSFFQKAILSEDTEYVIDASSLIILYQLEMQHKIKYPKRFVISPYIVDEIKRQLELLGFESKSEISLSITSEKVTPHFAPENYQENNKAYLTGLLAWIDRNCLVEISDRLLDMTRSMDKRGKEKPFFDYTLNTLLLAEDKEYRILITDDTNYLKSGLLRINRVASSEYFVKNLFGEDHAALYEFVRNKYLGFSPNTGQLNEEHNKKILSHPNFYIQCLENLNLLQNPNSAIPAIKHIKEITLNKIISPEQQKFDITNVFVNLLRGVDPGVRNHIEVLVQLDFRLLGKKLDLVIESLKSAYVILDIS